MTRAERLRETRVAPRAGGVDRNINGGPSTSSARSPPARGAWIATCGGIARWERWGQRRPPRGGRGSQHRAQQRVLGRHGRVAPRAGGVDRNFLLAITLPPRLASPPARGAWIATRDRSSRSIRRTGRPPRGGRGSQPVRRSTERGRRRSPPARGAWIATCQDSSEAVQRGSPPARGAWIATAAAGRRRGGDTGRPPRGGRGSQHHRRSN